MADWSLFRKSDSEPSNYDAYTYWNVNYTTEECYSHFTTKISTSILPQSWVKSIHKSEKLLSHENGHYKIAKILALTFSQYVRHTLFTDLHQIDKMFQCLLTEYLLLEVQYDKETDHFENNQMQLKWNTLLNNMFSQH
jgi:hypothetical protein